jgi:hypothetical protein
LYVSTFTSLELLEGVEVGGEIVGADGFVNGMEGPLGEDGARHGVLELKHKPLNSGNGAGQATAVMMRFFFLGFIEYLY